MTPHTGTSEPIFNAPRAVVGLIGVFIAIHVIRNFIDADTDRWLVLATAFIPMRLAGVADQLPGGVVSAVTSWLSHAFVHGDVFHLVINSAWMLAFGSAMVRRLGAARFFAFAAVCTIAGALAFLAGNLGKFAPMVGASGAIAGLMGGTFRFLFTAMSGPRPRDLHDNIKAIPRMSLGEAASDRRIILATVAWVVMNLVFGFGASALTSAAGIAWEAHLGGYFAGLLLFGWFDRGRSMPYDRSDFIPGLGPAPGPGSEDDDDHDDDDGFTGTRH